MIRTLLTFFLLLLLFFAPWAAVFSGAVLGSAVFPLYLEVFLLGFLASLLSDLALWKFVLALALVLLVQEKLKSSMNFSAPLLSVSYLWAVGLSVFLTAFFIFA